MDGPNSSWAPNETSATIYAEETWLQGNLLSNIAYGVELTLFVMCFTILVRQLNRFNYKRQMFLLIFISVIFVLGTVFMGAQAKFTQMAFIEYRNFPGGPSAYENAEYSVPVDEIANVCFIVGNWLMDAFLVRLAFSAPSPHPPPLLSVLPHPAGLAIHGHLQRGRARLGHRTHGPALPHALRVRR